MFIKLVHGPFKVMAEKCDHFCGNDQVITLVRFHCICDSAQNERREIRSGLKS